MIKLFLTFLFSFNLFAATSDFQSHFFINGEKIESLRPIQVNPGAPVLIEVYFTNPKTGEVHKQFKEMHGKFMHMVVLNRDLSIFKHIHPYLDPVTGRFAITLNMPYSDPDNQDAIATLQKPGMYMLMADVIVKNIGMRMDHAMVMVKGQNQPVDLVSDSQTNQIITKYFFRANETVPTYKTIFSKRLISGCSGHIVHFEIEMFHYVNGDYQPLLDFQPWLKEAGHAVWVSENFMGHMHHQMPFAHMHSPLIQEDESLRARVFDHILRFNFHDQEQMRPGLQKIWVQFKHRQKVMKIPFVFEYSPTPISGCLAPNQLEN